MKKAADVNQYIKDAPEQIHDRLKQIRSAILEVVPEAVEKISYGMPYYAYKGRLVYFAYAKAHIGIYAIFDDVRAQFREELKDYEMSKGTIRFPFDEKLPIGLIKKLIKAQKKRNEQNQKK